MGQFQLLNARFPVPLSKKTINQTLETVTLVVIIMTFNFNSGTNVSRGPWVNSTFRMAVSLFHCNKTINQTLVKKFISTISL